MYWLNLEQNGFSVSIEEFNGKKQFFLKKNEYATNLSIQKIKNIGFKPVENAENRYTAPLSYTTRNKLLSFDRAFLFPTTIEAKYEDPFHGFRDIRSRSFETHESALPQDAGVKDEDRGDRSIPGDDRRGSAGEDPRAVSAIKGEQSSPGKNESPGSGAPQQLVNEDSIPSSDEGNDLLSPGIGNTGAGDRRDGSMEPNAAGNEQRGPGRREVEEVEIVLKKNNPNHFYLNEKTFWTEFSNKDRFEANIEAIKTIKEIEKKEPPIATETEKGKLAQYAGWGSVDLNKLATSAYSIGRQYELTEEEQDSVSRSSLDAYYTSPEIINPVWQSIQDHLDFKGGEIIEPAVGIGNFIGLAPREIVERSTFHGTELDSLSGRMVKQIYPDANLHVRGFEDFHPPENYFDLAITNVPFGKNKPYDKNYQNGHSIHNYFICKSLSLLKLGGIGVYVTSSYTMDSVGTKARSEMNDKAHLLSAIRLPVDALKDHSNIEVMMDVLIFQRRVTPRSITEQEPDWINTHTSLYTYSPHHAPCELVTNEYFINNPDALAGQVSVVGERRYGEKWRRVIKADPDRPFEDLFPAILNATLSSPGVQETLKRNKEPVVSGSRIIVAEEPKEKLVELDTTVNMIGSFVGQDGKIYQIKYRSQDGLDDKTQGVEITGNPKKLKRLASFIELRDTLNEHYQIMKETEGDDPLYISHRGLLTVKYESFVAQYGYLNDKINVKEYRTDPEYCKIVTLEHNNPKTKKVERASIFSQRVLGKDKEITYTDSVKDAVSLSLNKYNTVNIEYIARLCEKDISIVQQELEGKIYKNPMTKNWEMSDIYLAGNVREKLRQAERAADYDAFFKVNVEALEKVIPQDIPAEDIAARVGVSWVPVQDYKEFIAKRLRIHINNVNLNQKEIDGSWTFYLSSQLENEKNYIEFGTSRKSFTDILKSSLHQRVVEVRDEIEVVENGEIKKKSVYNHKESIAAQYKQEELQNDFKEYLFFSDEKRTERMVRIYNDKMNSFVSPTFDGSHLTFPGLNPSFRPRSVQSDAVYRALHDSTLLNHEVGVGKTFEQIAIAMEMRRLGLGKKPLMVVASHTLGQINKDAQELYPGKKILMLTKEDFKPNNRKMFAGKVANNDWDLVIMGHSVFERIPMDKEFEEAFIQEQIGLFKRELQDIKESTSNLNKTEAARFGAKAIARKIASLESQLHKIADIDKDEGLQWSDLGFDVMLIDEAHRYKNLLITSSNSNIANMPASKRAQDLLLKVRHLENFRQDGKGVVFATGTPITNSPLEIYTMQRYLQMDELQDIGIARASDWYSNFIYPKVSWEPSHTGSGWNLRVRPCLQNVPELMTIFSSTMDTVTALDAEIVRPEVQYITEVSPMSPIQKQMMEDLDVRVKAKTDHIFTIMHTGRNMAIDPRLVLEFDGTISTQEDLLSYNDSEEIDPPYTKLNKLADKVVSEWEQSQEIKGTQLVFSDMGVPNKDRIFTVYNEIKKKLLERGVPAHEIQFIHDHEDDKAKEKLFDQVRSGDVRVLLGSSEKLATGTNVQDRIVAIHHADAPWTPDKVEQRNGRGLRYGNKNKDIRIYTYTTQDTFDLFQWNLLKIKKEQNKQILYGKGGARILDFELDPSYAETAALTSGNPLIREKLEVEEAVTKLEALHSHFLKEKYRFENQIKYRKEEIVSFKDGIKKLEDIPDIPESAVFKIKALKYDSLFGDDKELEFEANDIETVTKMLRMIREKNHRTRFLDDTLTFGDVPIKFFKKQASYDRNLSFNVWQVGDLERSSLRKAQGTIIAKHQTILRLEGKILDGDKSIALMKEKISSGFEKEHELVELKIKFSNIVRKIENLSNETLETPAHDAVKNNNLEEFIKMCDENPTLLDVQNEAGVTPADLIDELKRYDFQEYIDEQRPRRTA